MLVVLKNLKISIQWKAHKVQMGWTARQGNTKKLYMRERHRVGRKISTNERHTIWEGNPKADGDEVRIESGSSQDLLGSQTSDHPAGPSTPPTLVHRTPESSG